MSILVNFLKMPNNCDDCIVSCDCPVDASYDGYKMEGGRPRYCPLIELSPHGDLVDLNDVVHPNDSMKRMTIDEQLRRTCEGWSADRKQYVVIEAEGSEE